MTPRRHAIERDLFTALARCESSIPAVRDIASARLSRTLLMVRFLVAESALRGHPDAEVARQAYRALRDVQRVAPDAVRSVLTYPLVGAWALRCARALRSADPTASRPGRLAAVAAAAAVRGAVDVPVDLGWVDGPLTLPSLGTASLPTGRVALRPGRELVVGGTVVRVPLEPHQDAPGWRGIRRLTVEYRGFRLAALLDGTLPRTLPPELTPERDRLQVAEWTRRLGATWRVLVDHHPGVAAEVAELVRVIAPLPDGPVGPTSATLGDALGCVIMSLPPDDLFGAVTLTHETQHAKLAALMNVLPLVDEADGRTYYAPWRQDPRPVVGLLHGVYAHLGIAGFWRTQQAVEPPGERRWHAQVEFARWLEACAEVTGTLLASGALTEAGTQFVATMADTVADWRDVPLSRSALARARAKAEDHRARWASAG